MASSPSHGSETCTQEASPPLSLGFNTTHPGRAPGPGKPRGPSPRPPCSDSRPGRAPMTREPRLRPAPAPAPPGSQRPAGTAPSCPSQSAGPRGEGAQVLALRRGHRLVGEAVAHEAALRTRPSHSPSGKTAVGPRRPANGTRGAKGRGVREGGKEGPQG